MVSRPKIGILSIFFSFTLLVFSCEKSKFEPIPDVYIRFRMDLNDMEFNALGTLGNSVTVSRETNNWGSKAAGYDNNGIIVRRSLNDGYYAFDRSCPHCLTTNNLSVAVDVSDSYSTEAICPECGTSYSLDLDGMPLEGPGKYYLKKYNTELESGRFLSVWNNIR